MFLFGVPSSVRVSREGCCCRELSAVGAEGEPVGPCGTRPSGAHL